MLVTVQVSEEAPADVQEQIAAAAQAFGGTVRPLIPLSTDPQLKRYFAVEVPDAGQAQEAAAAFRQNTAVTAAYVKPADELP